MTDQNGNDGWGHPREFQAGNLLGQVSERNTEGPSHNRQVMYDVRRATTLAGSMEHVSAREQPAFWRVVALARNGVAGDRAAVVVVQGYVTSADNDRSIILGDGGSVLLPAGSETLSLFNVGACDMDVIAVAVENVQEQYHAGKGIL